MDSQTLQLPLLRYRNRALGPSDLAFVREHVAKHRHSNRKELARSLCVAWGWRQPSGGLSVVACVDLLLRLQEWGHVVLPPLQRAAARKKSLPVLPLELVALPWVEVRGCEVDLQDLQVRPVEVEERLGFKLFMQRYHYLGAAPLVGEHVLHAAFLGGEMVALLAWGAAALRAPLRERYIGWDETTKRRNLHLVANNVRFLIPPWVRVKRLASKVLAMSLRRLSRDWLQRWNHPVWLAETFVDVTRFRGTCYRAANWRRLGLTAGRSKNGNAYRRGGTPKDFYVFPLHRRAVPRLRQSEDRPQ